MRYSRGKYRIQAVADMTGVSAATLRAWERRYGLVVPERTSSSYRLYSDQDVAKIERVRDLCEAGTSASEAAQIVLQDQPLAEGRGVAPNEDPFEVAQSRILSAVEAFDPVVLEETVRGAMFLAQPEVTWERVLGPAMIEVGERWEAGEYSVAQEHLCSQIVGSAVADMLRMIQPREKDRRVLLACVDEEQHTLGLYGLAFSFAAWGIYTVILGARTPPAAIRHAASAFDPQLVGLSATMQIKPHRARALFDEYAAACGRALLLVGGVQAEPLGQVVEGVGGEPFIGDDKMNLRARVEALLSRSRSRKQP